jgi:hypothetical protein
MDIDRKVRPWDENAYKILQRTVEPLGSPPLPTAPVSTLDRIRCLDCPSSDNTLASCDPSFPPPPEAVAWRNLLESARVDDLVYSKALASQIKSLACTGDEEAIDVLRGTLGGLRNQFPDLILQHSITWERLTNSRLFATASEAPGLIDFIMSPACPVSASLSNVDRGELVGVKQWWVEHAAR